MGYSYMKAKLKKKPAKKQKMHNLHLEFEMSEEWIKNWDGISGTNMGGFLMLELGNSLRDAILEKQKEI